MKSTTVLMIVLCLLSVVNTSGQYKYSAKELYDNAEKEFYGFAMNDSGQIAGFFNVRNAGGEIKERQDRKSVV